MKNKFLKILLLFTFIFVISTDYCFAQIQKCNIKEADRDKYHLLESIPGVAKGCTVVEFPEYISKLYRFSFIVIATAALLMITIGGFYWLASAGNQSTASTAKKLIIDAVVGLIVALMSWLILNTINPDILKGELDTSAMKVKSVDKKDDSNWTEEDQKKFEEGLEAAERLENTDWDKINEDIDELIKDDEERRNRPDIFPKPDVDPNRETDGLTDEERQKIIEDYAKNSQGQVIFDSFFEEDFSIVLPEIEGLVASKRLSLQLDIKRQLFGSLNSFLVENGYEEIDSKEINSMPVYAERIDGNDVFYFRKNDVFKQWFLDNLFKK